MYDINWYQFTLKNYQRPEKAAKRSKKANSRSSLKTQILINLLY